MKWAGRGGVWGLRGTFCRESDENGDLREEMKGEEFTTERKVPSREWVT